MAVAHVGSTRTLRAGRRRSPWVDGVDVAGVMEACGSTRRGRRQLGVGIDLQLDFLMLVIVDVVVAPGSGFSSASLSRRRAVVSKGARPWLAASLSKPSLPRWSSSGKNEALVCAVCA